MKPNELSRFNILNFLNFFNFDCNSKILMIGKIDSDISKIIEKFFSNITLSKKLIKNYKVKRNLIKKSNYKIDLLDEKYDLIFLFDYINEKKYFSDLKEIYDFTKNIKNLLTSTGRLIILFNNPINLKHINDVLKYRRNIVEYIKFNKYSKNFWDIIELEHLLDQKIVRKIEIYYSYQNYQSLKVLFKKTHHTKDIYPINWLDFPLNEENIKYKRNYNEIELVEKISKINLLSFFAKSYIFVISNGDEKTSATSWIIKKCSFERYDPFKVITSLNTENKLLIYKKYLFERNLNRNFQISTNNKIFHINHKISINPWIAGRSLILDIHNAMYKKKPYNEILKIIYKWYNFVISSFSTGGKDEKGYPMLYGDSIDLLFRNFMINSKKDWVPIDFEYSIKEHISADFLMFRAIFNDIMPIFRKYHKKEVSIINEKFILMNIMLTFFPFYDYNRYKINYDFNFKFVSSVSTKKNIYSTFFLFPVISELYGKIKIIPGLNVVFSILFKIFQMKF